MSIKNSGLVLSLSPSVFCFTVSASHVSITLRVPMYVIRNIYIFLAALANTNSNSIDIVRIAVVVFSVVDFMMWLLLLLLYIAHCKKYEKNK